MGATSVAARSLSRHARCQGQALAASPRGTYRPNAGGVAGQEQGGAEDGAAGATQPWSDATQSESGARDHEVAAVDRLLATAEAVDALDLVALTDAQLEAHLGRLRRPLAVLEAARARALSELERRVRRTAGPDRVTGEVLEARRRAAKDQRMSPSDAKRAAEAGSHADKHPTTGEAFRAGDVGPVHVRLLGEALEQLPSAQRDQAEGELLELARTCDPVTFGRRVREYLAQHAPRELHQQEKGQHRQRRFRMTDTEDGGVAFSGQAYGTAAELARTALQAFRRPDTPEEHRTPEQRSADAFEQLCDAALRLGDAPTVHGERPHVVLVVEESQLQQDAGVGRFAHSSQPITLAEVGTLLTDCAVSRVVRDADRVPIEVTKSVRTVPMGLWRALVVRDGGCRWEGCDAPASWCDVAHGEHAYRSEGRLCLSNATLLCRRHHRRFDKGPWRLQIDGDQVTFHREQTAYSHPLDRSAGPPRGRQEATTATSADHVEARAPLDVAGGEERSEDSPPRAGPSLDEAVGTGPPLDDAGPGDGPQPENKTGDGWPDEHTRAAPVSDEQVGAEQLDLMDP